MKTKVKNSIFCLLVIILSSFSACFNQTLIVQQLTSDEEWYVGRWELSRITHIASTNPRYQLFYPARGNDARTVLFNEIGSEYWGRTSFVFLDNKVNGEIDGYLQIGESKTDFKWSNTGSKNRDISMKFSRAFYFDGINESGEKIRKAVSIISDDNDNNDIYDDELVLGVNAISMIYVFVRAEE